MPSRFVTISLILWLASLALLTWVLVRVREQTVAAFETPEAQAAWQKWQDEVARQNAEENTPVQRRPPKSPEPPTLVMLRDNFAVILAGALVTWSCFFGFTAVIVRGMLLPKDKKSAVAFGARDAKYNSL